MSETRERSDQDERAHTSVSERDHKISPTIDVVGWGGRHSYIEAARGE